MKAHLTKISLALLSTVFLLGCQDMGSEPVGPDGLVPQFDKPKANPSCEMPDDGHCHGDDEEDVGGSTGNQVTPAKITFRDSNLGQANGDRIASDSGFVQEQQGAATGTGTYFHKSSMQSSGERVFIGSQANTGNIIFKIPDQTRALFLNFSACGHPLCPPTGGGTLFRTQHSVVQVKKAIKDGVFAIGRGESVDAAMQVRLQPLGADVAYGDQWFLFFDPGHKMCEGSTKVRVTGLTQDKKWEVEAGADGSTAIGCLITGGSPKFIFLGLFSLPFKFEVEVL